MTLRQLLWMAEARSKDAWARTSAVMALLANLHRDPKKTRPFRPIDFDPYAVRDKHDEAIVVEDMAVLRQAFEGHKERKPT